MVIMLDHDLGEKAMIAWENSIETNTIDYDNINEMTGYDCAKYLVEVSMDTKTPLPVIFVHSFNNVGSQNIVALINNYLHFCGLPETCKRVQIPFVLSKPYPGTNTNINNEENDK